MNKNLTKDIIEPLVIGGSILGGGGGGSIQEGLKMARLAFEMGTPTIISLDELEDQDKVITVSAVGAPAAKNQYVKPVDYIKTVQLLETFMGERPKAMMTNENGGIASVNGLVQSAVLGIPVIDGACNGRAHPTGVMGSIRLNEVKDYESIQVAIGGQPGTDYRVMQVVKGKLDTCSRLVRQASVIAGGLVAVARNPVTAAYVRRNGAIGAITHAVQVGQAHLSGVTPHEKVRNVIKVLGGEVIAQGTVKNLHLETVNGFDLGSFKVHADAGVYELTFWNEYMTCDTNDQRLATFPDLLMTFSAETGMPVPSADLKEEENVILIYAPYKNILLGSGMLVESNYHIVEKTLNKQIIKYIKSLFNKEVMENVG